MRNQYKLRGEIVEVVQNYPQDSNTTVEKQNGERVTVDTAELDPIYLDEDPSRNE